MSLFRNICLIWLVLTLVCPPVLAEAPDAVLSTMPGDVAAAVAVFDLRQADSDYRMTINALGLKDKIPADQLHPLDRLKEKLPPQAAFHDNGTLALVVLRSGSLPELLARLVVLLPAVDPARLLDDLGAQPAVPGEDKIRSISLFDQSLYAVATEKHVAVSKSLEVARLITRQKTLLKDRLSQQDRAALQGLDACAWIDASLLLRMFKPQIDGLIGWALMMQMGAGEVGEAEARATKKQLDAVVEGISSLLLGISLSEQGVGLRITASTKPDSELARQTRHAQPRAHLLRGLPRRHYLVVFGQELHPVAIEAGIDTNVIPVLADLRHIEGIDPLKLKALQDDLLEASRMTRAIRGSIEQISVPDRGMVTASLIFETSDSKAWLGLIQKIAMGLSNLSSGPEEDAEKAPRWCRWTAGAETLEEATIAHWFFDPTDSEWEEAEIEGFKTIVGPEGLLIRLAAADPHHVACTLGGGAPAMARLLRSIRRNESPLEEAPGIALATKGLPASRTGEVFIAIDRIIDFVNDMAYEIEGIDFIPFWPPWSDAPLAVSTGGTDGWSRHDVFAPMPLLAGLVEGFRNMESYDDIEWDEADDDEVPQPDVEGDD